MSTRLGIAGVSFPARSFSPKGASTKAVNVRAHMGLAGHAMPERSFQPKLGSSTAQIGYVGAVGNIPAANFDFNGVADTGYVDALSAAATLTLDFSPTANSGFAGALGSAIGLSYSGVALQGYVEALGAQGQSAITREFIAQALQGLAEVGVPQIGTAVISRSFIGQASTATVMVASGQAPKFIFPPIVTAEYDVIVASDTHDVVAGRETFDVALTRDGGSSSLS